MRKKSILFVILLILLLVVLTACLNKGPEVDKDSIIVAIEVSVPEDTSFFVGNTFNKENFIVSAVLANGEKSEFENLNGVHFNIYDKFNGSYIIDEEEKFIKTGEFELTVTFNDKVDTVKIVVKEEN